MKKSMLSILLGFLFLFASAQPTLTSEDLFFAPSADQTEVVATFGYKYTKNKAGDSVYQLVQIKNEGKQKGINTYASAGMSAASDTTLISAIEAAIKGATGREVHITLPNMELTSNGLNATYIFLTGIFASLLLLLINKAWPSAKKPQLILKSTMFGLTIIIVVLKSVQSGATINVMSISTLLAFAVKTFFYDNVLKGLRIRSKKPKNYTTT